MTTSGTLTRAVRLLCMAGWLVSCLLAVSVATATTVDAHPGHRHVAAGVETQASSGSSNTEAAPASERALDATLAADLSGPHERVTVATASPAASAKTTGHCACGGTCGSCSSMSCCPAILTDVRDLFQSATTQSGALPHAFALYGGSVAPLPRPPNLPLIV